MFGPNCLSLADCAPPWGDQSIHEQNAKLIAAAPDLLKVCNNILHWAEYDERGLRDDLEGDLLAAIAKATGADP